MKIIPIGRQKWEGYFTYVNELEDGTISEDRVSFEMELVFDNGSFSGTTVDEETKGLFDEPITVNGFVVENEISFIVMYPHNYLIGEDGGVVIDHETDYPGCEYEGEFDADENKFIGEWHLIAHENRQGIFQSSYLQEVHSGNWEMWRSR